MLLGFCADTHEVWEFVGKFIWVIRIVIPVILLIIGTVTFGKAIIADDDKEIKSAVTKLIKKLIIAAIIFFLPTIVKALFNLLLPTNANTGEHDWVTCVDKLL